MYSTGARVLSVSDAWHRLSRSVEVEEQILPPDSAWMIQVREHLSMTEGNPLWNSAFKTYLQLPDRSQEAVVACPLPTAGHHP
jgi:hypothetical protein